MLVLIGRDMWWSRYLKNPAENSLWPFSFGLSYTTFSLSQLTLSSTVLHADTETAAIQSSITVKNTGNVVGDEVVFLFKKSAAPVLAWHKSQYPNNPPPEAPVRELIGFERVSLAPGAY
jgi:beta-glucosidase